MIYSLTLFDRIPVIPSRGRRLERRRQETVNSLLGFRYAKATLRTPQAILVRTLKGLARSVQRIPRTYCFRRTTQRDSGSCSWWIGKLHL